MAHYEKNPESLENLRKWLKRELLAAFPELLSKDGANQWLDTTNWQPMVDKVIKGN